MRMAMPFLSQTQVLAWGKETGKRYLNSVFHGSRGAEVWDCTSPGKRFDGWTTAWPLRMNRTTQGRHSSFTLLQAEKKEKRVNDFSEHCRKVAERFLQTVVVVDDEAGSGSVPPSNDDLKVPGRGSTTDADEQGVQEERPSERHSLDTQVLVNSFAEKGLVCGVVTPRLSGSGNVAVVLAAKRADMVVLDWQLQNDDGKAALSMIKGILNEDAGKRLRLIAVYTGASDIRAIAESIENELSEWEFQRDNGAVTLSYGHCRIEIYAKSGTQLDRELLDRSVEEAQVADVLISNFAEMTRGLLPCIALTSLAAIRENAHKILDKFNTELDPAFLAHRACLPAPDDSQQHIVNNLAGELHGIMDDAVAKVDPAGMRAIRQWLTEKQGGETEWELAPSKTLKFAETVALLSEGLAKKNGPLSKNTAFKTLSWGFSRGNTGKEEIDHQLAWMMNFRAVTDNAVPILHLGTVVQRDAEVGEDEFFLCMRPKCDSLRLHDVETFHLLPLVAPVDRTTQLVIRAMRGPNEYRRLSVGTSASNWSLVKFEPDQERECVVAKQAPHGFYFDDVDGTRYRWLGELKADVAQDIIQRFASGLARVAVDNSEWLRRYEKLEN